MITLLLRNVSKILIMILLILFILVPTLLKKLKI